MLAPIFDHGWVGYFVQATISGHGWIRTQCVKNAVLPCSSALSLGEVCSTFLHQVPCNVTILLVFSVSTAVKMAKCRSVV